MSQSAHWVRASCKNLLLIRIGIIGLFLGAKQEVKRPRSLSSARLGRRHLKCSRDLPTEWPGPEGAASSRTLTLKLGSPSMKATFLQRQNIATVDESRSNIYLRGLTVILSLSTLSARE